MARTERPYVRVYYIDLERDYPKVWADPGALGTWTLLLALADKMWPSKPELPRSVTRTQIAKLTAPGREDRPGLLELLSGHRFTVKGYDKERVGRQVAAKVAADKRWHADSSADGTPGRNAQSNAGRTANGHVSAMPNTESETEFESKDSHHRSRRTGARPLPEPAESPEQEPAWLAGDRR